MIRNKDSYRKYLKEYKNKKYPDSPSNDDSYIDWWESAMERDLLESADHGGWNMHFHPFQKDGQLLVLDKKGNLPEYYKKKFQAYPIYGNDLNLNVEVKSNIITDDGILFNIIITPRGTL